MKIETPIEFPVSVNGKNLLASVEEDVSNPVQSIFRVRFSDGYVDDFLLSDEDGLIYGSNIERSKPYALSLNNDMPIVCGINPEKFYHVFQEEIDGIEANIWVIEKENDSGEISYGVYYNSFYRFELQKLNDEWTVSDFAQSDNNEIDPDLADKVEKLLYSVVD